MKKMLNSTTKRFVSLIMVMACLFATYTTAFAYEAPTMDDCTEGCTNLIPIEETDISREEAIQMLGLTGEKARNAQIYSTNTEVINSGQFHNSGYFQFTGENGGAYRTMNGDELSYSVVWKALDDNSAYLNCYLWPYGGLYIDHGYLSNATTTMGGEDGTYRLYVSGWKKITRGLDYRLTYSCNSMETGQGARCEIRVIIAVV